LHVRCCAPTIFAGVLGLTIVTVAVIVAAVTAAVAAAAVAVMTLLWFLIPCCCVRRGATDRAILLRSFSILRGGDAVIHFLMEWLCCMHILHLDSEVLRQSVTKLQQLKPADHVLRHHDSALVVECICPAYLMQ